MADGTCSVDGCERPVHSRNWCGKHYQRWWRYGHPTEDLRGLVSMERQPRGNVDYFHMHSIVRFNKGPARMHACDQRCGRTADYWAYDHSDDNELVSDEGLAYSLDPERYRPLCASCHRRFDGEVVNVIVDG